MNDHRLDPSRFLRLLGQKRPRKDEAVLLVRWRECAVKRVYPGESQPGRLWPVVRVPREELRAQFVHGSARSSDGPASTNYSDRRLIRPQAFPVEPEREVLRTGPRDARAYLLQRAIEGNARNDGWRYEVVVA